MCARSLRSAGAVVNRPGSNQTCPPVKPCYPGAMADGTPPPALDRIDRALARIDAALAARTRASKDMIRRHAALRARMEEAVAALDDLIGKGGGA